ncbi:MAG: hypothetical protein LOD94_05450 [Gammaproteobacteria bacterium]|nr:hypothetical protein [Gammaproteobacteria bacterium]
MTRNEKIIDRPTRRGLLAAIAATAAAALFPKRAPATPRTSVLRRIARVGAEASEVGARYLRAEPTEADLAALEAKLVERLRAARGAIPTRLDEATRADFRRGDVVVVDGWVVSRTEARVCAVAHLLESGESG